ncbi:MAG: hypothetical protein LBG15_11965 [Dysgonamonadaceae bacterium]|jgi:hypothetical protein|nr:hypothetical protein [Dysgonamonadaceae bacterium]
MSNRNEKPAQFDPKLPITQQRYEVILAHILDPDNSPLPEEYREKFNRIKSAAVMLDDYHPANVIPRLVAKYDITKNTAREDIKLAQELFKSKHSFDYDFWQQWQIKDLVDTIRTCKLKGKEKERIAAQKVLKEIIGPKPESSEDPKRMEKNVFYIQLNNNQTTVNVPMDKLKGLTQEEIRTIVASLTAPEVEDAQIVDILNT